jgi:hypothetical protein
LTSRSATARRCKCGTRWCSIDTTFVLVAALTAAAVLVSARALEFDVLTVATIDGSLARRAEKSDLAEHLHFQKKPALTEWSDHQSRPGPGVAGVAVVGGSNSAPAFGR